MADCIINTTNSVNTLIGLVNQITAQMGSSLIPMMTTTINSKRQVQPLAEPTPGTHPSLKYFGIGIKGFYNVNTDILSQSYVPSEEDMDLYQPIPFRMVPLENDLTPEERAKYRMRTVETVANIEYATYWLKMIDFPDTNVDITRVDLTTNEEDEYTFDPANLSPVPDRNNGVDQIANASSRVIVSTDGACAVTGAEVEEAIRILYGNDKRYARISEWGFYTGEDRICNALDANGVSFDYTEAIYVQLATKRCGTGSDMSDPASIAREKIVYESANTYLL